MTHPLPCHGRFVLNTYSNKNKWLDIFRRVTNGNNKQKQIVSNEWHGIPGIRNNELRLEQIYRGYHATIIAEVLDGGVQDRLRDHGEKTLRYTPASVPGARQTMCCRLCRRWRIDCQSLGTHCSPAVRPGRIRLSRKAALAGKKSICHGRGMALEMQGFINGASGS